MQPDTVDALRELLHLPHHTLRLCVDEREFQLSPESMAPHQARLTLLRLRNFLQQYKSRPLPHSSNTLERYMKPRARTAGKRVAPHDASQVVQID